MLGLIHPDGSAPGRDWTRATLGLRLAGFTLNSPTDLTKIDARLSVQLTKISVALVNGHTNGCGITQKSS